MSWIEAAQITTILARNLIPPNRYGTINTALTVDGSQMPSIKNPSNTNRAILGRNPDAMNDQQGVFRHMFASAAMAQLTNESTAREIMNNHDSFVNQYYSEYSTAMKNAGKQPVSFGDISNGAQVERPQNWDGNKFKQFLDSVADLKNNERGYQIGNALQQRDGTNYNRLNVTLAVAADYRINGGYTGAFNANATQGRIVKGNITQGQYSNIVKRVGQLNSQASSLQNNNTTIAQNTPQQSVAQVRM
jgi:hypothetical protein